MGNELQHHGILGMKWGRRNGPPYPLTKEQLSAVERREQLKNEKRELRRDYRETKKKLKSARTTLSAERNALKAHKDDYQMSKYEGDKYEAGISRKMIKASKLRAKAAKTDIGVYKRELRSIKEEQRAIKLGLKECNEILKDIGHIRIKDIDKDVILVGKDSLKEVLSEEEPEIKHHGILGMKWGHRNGPPYPLDASDHSASEKKAGWRKSLSNDGKEDSVKKRWLGKNRSDNTDESKKTESDGKATEQKDPDEDKKRAISSGKASDILKYVDSMSTNELNDARNRVNTINDLKKARDSEKTDKKDKILKSIKGITEVVRTGMDLYDQFSRAEKAFKKEEISIGQKKAQSILENMESMSVDDLKEAVTRIGFYEKIEKSANSK